jgi:hypothetical protein
MPKRVKSKETIRVRRRPPEPLGSKLEDLVGRTMVAFMACDDGDSIEIELLQARYYLERARAIARGVDDLSTVKPERLDEWCGCPVRKAGLCDD